MLALTVAQIWNLTSERYETQMLIEPFYVARNLGLGMHNTLLSAAFR